MVWHERKTIDSKKNWHDLVHYSVRQFCTSSSQSLSSSKSREECKWIIKLAQLYKDVCDGLRFWVNCSFRPIFTPCWFLQIFSMHMLLLSQLIYKYYTAVLVPEINWETHYISCMWFHYQHAYICVWCVCMYASVPA